MMAFIESKFHMGAASFSVILLTGERSDVYKKKVHVFIISNGSVPAFNVLFVHSLIQSSTKFDENKSCSFCIIL